MLCETPSSTTDIANDVSFDQPSPNKSNTDTYKHVNAVLTVGDDEGAEEGLDDGMLVGTALGMDEVGIYEGNLVGIEVGKSAAATATPSSSKQIYKMTKDIQSILDNILCCTQFVLLTQISLFSN